MKMRKWIAVAIILSMFVVVACTQKEESSNPTDSSNDIDNKTGDPYYGKYDPPITISTFRELLAGGYNEFADETTTDNLWSRYEEEELGIKWNVVWEVPSGNDAYKQKRNLAITSGDIPDMFVMDPSDPLYRQLAEDGLIQPLDEFYDKNLIPEIKAYLEENDGMLLNRAKIDGKLYGLPLPAASYMSVNILWIRQDWLDNLGLAVPTTIEELTNVAKMFVEKDPDGNNQDDTSGIPIPKSLTGWISSADGFMGAFGASKGNWIEDAGGKLVYSSVQPEMKAALAQLHKWFDDGLIDPEFGVKDEGKVAEDIIAEKYGIFAGPYWGAEWPGMANNPDANFVPVRFPAGPNGINKYVINPGMGSGVVVASKDFKHPESIMKQINLQYKGVYAPDSTFGHPEFMEGRHWEKSDDGTVTMLGGKNYPHMYYYWKTDQWFPPSFETRVKEDAELSEFNKFRYETLKDAQPYTSLGWTALALLDEISKEDNGSKVISTKWVYGPTETMASKSSILEKLESEVFNKIIMGREPIDSFDAFVKQWHDLGGAEITEEVNEFISK